MPAPRLLTFDQAADLRIAAQARAERLISEPWRLKHRPVHPLPLPEVTQAYPLNDPSQGVWRPVSEIEGEIRSRDLGRCRYCGIGDVNMEIDHVWPRALGGDNRAENLVLACVSCNSQKKDKVIYEEWFPRAYGVTMLGEDG